MRGRGEAVKYRREVLDSIIEELSSIGKRYSNEFGLPTFDEGQMALMRERMREILAHVDYWTNSGGSPEEAYANARLIAAAPDLYEALKDVLKHGGSTSGEWVPEQYYKAAEAALAKAEGK